MTSNEVNGYVYILILTYLVQKYQFVKVFVPFLYNFLLMNIYQIRCDIKFCLGQFSVHFFYLNVNTFIRTILNCLKNFLNFKIFYYFYLGSNLLSNILSCNNLLQFTLLKHFTWNCTEYFTLWSLLNLVHKNNKSTEKR